MREKIFLLIFLLKVSLEIELNDNWILPDYDFNFITERENLRRRFLDRKMENDNQYMRLKLFDTLSNTVYSENILHMKSEQNQQNYEKLFRNLLSMNGVTYVFKRGFYWRTWRKINIMENSEAVICYKCQNYFNNSYAKCFNGYWVIDEKPPCPYEIYSVVKPKILCVVNITEFHKPFKPCPQVISLEKLLETCNNPIVTKWRIIRNYSAKENTIGICQGRDSCEITTLYLINPDSITFRIINSTSHIIYSRIMKNKGQNYACENNCGYLKPNLEVVKNNEHIILDLLEHNPKQKRENFQMEKILKVQHKLATPVTIVNAAKKNEHVNFKNSSITTYGFHKLIKSVTSKKSPCKKIQDSYMHIDENLSEYDY